VAQRREHWLDRKSIASVRYFAGREPENRCEAKMRTVWLSGKVLGHYKMAKHFELVIEDADFRFERRQSQIDAEVALDGIYVIRTSVVPETASTEQAVSGGRAGGWENGRLTSAGP